MSTTGLLGNGISSTRSGDDFEFGCLRLASSFSRLLGTAVQPLSSMVFDMVTGFGCGLVMDELNEIVTVDGGCVGCSASVTEDSVYVV